MNAVASSAGIPIRWVEASNWAECLKLMRAGAVDVLVGTARSREREEFMTFTDPYLDAPLAIIVRMDSPFLSLPQDMEGRVAALPEGYINTEYFRRRHPQARVSVTTTAEQAFRFVSRGDADYTVENLVSANHLITRGGYANLKIGGVLEASFALRYGVGRHALPVAGMLDRALGAFPEARKQEILARWIAPREREHIDWARVRMLAVALVVLAAAIAGVVLYRNALLQRELRVRRKIQRELEEAHERLTRLNEEKNRFMAMAAHDLKNPLTALGMTLEALPSLGEAERRTELGHAAETVRYMCSLVRNLLDAHAIDQGALTVARTRLALFPVLRRSLDQSRGTAARKGITLEADLDPRAGEVEGDEDALAQVMDNLLSNAIKFSPAGTRVCVAVRPAEDGFVRVEVCDEGPGIPETDKPRLFERFARLTARPTDAESSTGLGLSIVKRLVEAMGGAVGAESRPGRGAVFFFTLPAGADDAVGSGS